MKNFKTAKGFTLTELLIVVSIIGTLASLVIVNFRSAQMRGRDAVRKSDLRNIQTALRLYYNDYGTYPAGTSTITACGSAPPTNPIVCGYGSAWTRAGVTYMSILPKEPLQTPDYVYTFVNGDDYTLRTCLESRSDPKCDVPAVATSVCASTCRYTVRP